MIISHIIPDMMSPDGMLRAKVFFLNWLYNHQNRLLLSLEDLQAFYLLIVHTQVSIKPYAQLTQHLESFKQGIAFMTKLFNDPLLPVRLYTAISLKYVIQIEQGKELLLPVLPQALEC